MSTVGFPGQNWLGTLLMARRAELRVSESTAQLVDQHTLAPIIYGLDYVDANLWYDCA
jgi:hypothetical protein